MINERIMSQGSFDLAFTLEAPLSLWKDISEFGHILITPQAVDHRLLDDATMLATSRYTGVILNKKLDETGLKLNGASLVWWLGDDQGRADVLETKVTLTSSTLDNALTNVLPTAITKGTVTEPAGTTYTGEHQWESPLEAVRTIVASMGCEYRVNPDGTIDAGPNNSVYNIDDADIQVVVTRKRYSGGDSLLKGVDVDAMRTELDARNYISRAIVTTVDSNNVETLVGGQDRSPAPTYKDLFGNTIDRVLKLETSGTPVEVTLYLTTQMNENTLIQNMDISTEFYEIASGDMRVGDAFWAYDPPAFDTSADASPNEVWFRGGPIFPEKLRLIAASWPVRPGMGIYYRPPTASPVADDYLDLTPYVKYEDQNRGRMGVRV